MCLTGQAMLPFPIRRPSGLFFIALFTISPHSPVTTLTARSANHVYLLEPLMNPAAEAQAIGRSMCQSRPVTVTRMLIKVPQ